MLAPGFVFPAGNGFARKARIHPFWCGSALVPQVAVRAETVSFKTAKPPASKKTCSTLAAAPLYLKPWSWWLGWMWNVPCKGRPLPCAGQFQWLVIRRNHKWELSAAPVEAVAVPHMQCGFAEGGFMAGKANRFGFPKGYYFQAYGGNPSRYHLNTMFRCHSKFSLPGWCFSCVGSKIVFPSNCLTA